MNNIINNAFKHKMELYDTPTPKLAEMKAIFTNDLYDNKYTANDNCKMIKFWWITCMFGGQLFRQMVGIPMRTNIIGRLVSLFL